MSQPANTAIYGSTNQLIPVEKLREIAGDAETITAKRTLLGSITQFTLQWPDLQIVMNVMTQQTFPDIWKDLWDMPCDLWMVGRCIVK